MAEVGILTDTGDGKGLLPTRQAPSTALSQALRSPEITNSVWNVVSTGQSRMT